jgi:hypothetical protein
VSTSHGPATGERSDSAPAAHNSIVNKTPLSWPSRMSAAISSIATLGRSGTASELVSNSIL